MQRAGNQPLMALQELANLLKTSGFVSEIDAPEVARTRRGWKATVELQATVGAVAAWDSGCARSRWLVTRLVGSCM